MEIILDKQLSLAVAEKPGVPYSAEALQGAVLLTPDLQSYADVQLDVGCAPG